MLLGAVVVPFALVLRRRLPETLELQGAKPSYRPTRAQLVLGLLTVVMLASATIATYTLNYMNIFATHTLGMPSAVAFGALLIGGGSGMIFNTVGGLLSDRYGRKPMMISGYGLLCLAAIPCFVLMSHWRTPLVLYACSALMPALLGLGTPAIMCALMESLPPQMRSGVTGIIYAFAIAIFGGSASLVVAWLTELTGSPLAPAGYMCVALAVGVLAMVGIRETAPVKASG
jgi:MFS family permease